MLLEEVETKVIEDNKDDNEKNEKSKLIELQSDKNGINIIMEDVSVDTNDIQQEIKMNGMNAGQERVVVSNMSAKWVSVSY